MPVFDFECSCGYVFEEYLTTTELPPSVCPKCKKVGEITKLFPTNIQVRIALSGHEFRQKLADDEKQIRRELQTNEKLRANICGEDKYHQISTEQSNLSKDLKNL